MNSNQTCPACKKQKQNLEKFEFRGFEDESRIICKDCQKIIEWYNYEIDDMKAREL